MRDAYANSDTNSTTANFDTDPNSNANYDTAAITVSDNNRFADANADFYTSPKSYSDAAATPNSGTTPVALSVKMKHIRLKKKHHDPIIGAHRNRGAFYLLLLIVLCATPFASAQRRQVELATSKENPNGSGCYPPSWRAGPDMPSTGVRMVGVYFPANGKFYAIGGRSMDGIGNDFTRSNAEKKNKC
jgi:hypothetical protein